MKMVLIKEVVQNSGQAGRRNRNSYIKKANYNSCKFGFGAGVLHSRGKNRVVLLLAKFQWVSGNSSEGN